MKAKYYIIIGGVSIALLYFLTKRKVNTNGLVKPAPDGATTTVTSTTGATTTGTSTTGGTTTGGTTTGGKPTGASNISPKPIDVVPNNNNPLKAEQERLAEIARLKAIENSKLAEIARLKVIEDARQLEIARLKARELEEKENRTQEEANQLRYYQEIAKAKEVEIARLKNIEDARLKVVELARLKLIEDTRLALKATEERLKLIEDTRLALLATEDERLAQILNAKTVQGLRDEIVANIGRRNSYKTQGSKNAVQADINNQLNKLKGYGYSLDDSNNLIKIGSDYLVSSSNINRNFLLEQTLTANAIQKLRDEIVANIGRRNSYKTQGSKNAVQADINNQLNKLKEYGYSLDNSNNLIEVASDYLVSSSDDNRNFIIEQTLTANAIQKLRDEIVANIGRRNSYKTQGSKNAVQADINNQLNRLKEYGYSLDNSNNLIEVASDYLVSSSDDNRNFIISQTLTANAVKRLRDEIVANIGRRNSYKTQGSKNAVQADINNQLNRLKEYGYSLDNSNNLIEVESYYVTPTETINDDVYSPRGRSTIEEPFSFDENLPRYE